jgi:hypothetical protein
LGPYLLIKTAHTVLETDHGPPSRLIEHEVCSPEKKARRYCTSQDCCDNLMYVSQRNLKILKHLSQLAALLGLSCVDLEIEEPHPGHEIAVDGTLHWLSPLATSP